VWGALLAGWVVCGPQGAFLSEAAPVALQVIPQLREVKVLGGGFEAAGARFIGVSEQAADRFAARLLQEALRETHGVDCRIVPLPPETANWHRLWLGASADLPGAGPPPPVHEREGYGLRVDAAGALIAAENETGLFYGAQTLIQLLEQSRREATAVPGMVVADWPTFAWRGRYFDGSQYLGTVVTTRANLEREIKLLARYKLNCLCFDAYNLVPFKSFPSCADANTLSLSDWEYLVELARRYQVTFFPSLQSFAQMYQVLWNCEEGKPYREETAPGLVCPSRPENLRFLQGLYRDLISVFKYSPILGIGCSEVDMQWQKRYCALCRRRLEQGETLHDIYWRHVGNCVQAVEAAAKEAGRPLRPMMWADEFYCGYNNQRWVGLEHIPTRTLMGHWQYWSRYQNLAAQQTKDYDGIAGLLARGFDVFFLSASFEFNTYLHDLSPKEPADGKWEVLLDAGIYNIADQARWAEAHNQKGLPGRVWGGACATFSQHDIRCWDTTWYAYALQAEYSWGDPKRPLDDELSRFTDCFAATFYRARDQQTAQAIAAAYRELDAVKSDLERNNYLIRDIIGEYDIHDASYQGNELEASLKLIAQLAAHPQGPGKTLADIRQRCDHALSVTALFRQKLAAAAARVQNTLSLHYLVSAAHKMENHAQRTLFLLDLAEALQKMALATNTVSRQPLRQVFSELQRRCAALQGDTRLIADEMDELAHGAAGRLIWEGASTEKAALSTAADTTGYHQVLASLEGFGKQLEAALATATAARASYPDGRPEATLRMEAKDQGVVLKHGDGPGECDKLGARDVWVFAADGKYYMHYDGAGPKGWLACLATSTDLAHWTKQGPVLDLGKPGEDDSASASYGVTFFDGQTWHMFYLGTPHTSPAPDLIPAFPYLTLKARSPAPSGPWTKQREVVPFRCAANTYYEATASPGQVLRRGEEYLMFFSASANDSRGTHRTISIARTRDLNGPWRIDLQPIVPPAEQIENTSLYFEPTNQTWFLFSNHIGLEGFEYTDAVWVYWTKDLDHWNGAHKAVVLDGQNCGWSRKCLGLPSVVPVGRRLAVFYDAPGGESKSHMQRDVGLAWLDLPLWPPPSADRGAQ